ncbi:MAG: hypothetical protein EXX96DRAFT_595820 [Benjaminiella poitrasii]|nr:MAG: hypothetical protein EXX96DRAFT_595820 [Benjaminiella poitrasii]
MEDSQVVTNRSFQAEEEEDNESDYSLDYEYVGHRKAVYRDEDDNDSIASELSLTLDDNYGFDMWDEDPYSTNDFTWESNDMRLTEFMIRRQQELNSIKTPWHQQSFWKKESGWPRQLPASHSTTNHDQSANALSLVLSDFGTSEKLHAIFRDRIIECGGGWDHTNIASSPPSPPFQSNTTWLDSNDVHHPKDLENKTSSSSSSSSNKFIETHAAYTYRSSKQQQQRQQHQHYTNNTTTGTSLISNFLPYTKYLKRSQFPTILPSQSYLTLSYEPMCLAEKYGYMAIGGIEGEFELPDGQHLICIGDAACLFHFTISFDDVQIRLSAPHKFVIPPTVLSSKPFFSSQYLAWSATSRYLAHTSDSHETVFVWRTQPHFELVYCIDAGGYTYAIQFHPIHEGLLVFTNRYGYLHTVDLDSCVQRQDPGRVFKLWDAETRTDVVARQEITMVSFRGEKSRRLRILAKINGIQWSRDGRYLYVATKKRVLAYAFQSGHIESLERLASKTALGILEQHSSKRKQKTDGTARKKRRKWQEECSRIPTHIRDRLVNNNTCLASHWQKEELT